jgi:hypothetical protein
MVKLLCSNDEKRILLVDLITGKDEKKKVAHAERKRPRGRYDPKQVQAPDN